MPLNVLKRPYPALPDFFNLQKVFFLNNKSVSFKNDLDGFKKAYRTFSKTFPKVFKKHPNLF